MCTCIVLIVAYGMITITLQHSTAQQLLVYFCIFMALELCHNFLPEQTMGNFDVFLDQYNMVCMKSGQGAASKFRVGVGVRTHGEYTECIGDAESIFKYADMAPPSGVFGQDYLRCAHQVAISRLFFQLPKLGTESHIQIPCCSFACKRSHLFNTGQNASTG